MRPGDVAKNYISAIGAKIAYTKCSINKLKNSDYRKALNANKRFRNIHMGRRCFILGNGPSLKKQDLSLLSKDVVFCVNQCIRNVEIKKAKPRYYVCVDKNLFNINTKSEEDLELLKTYIKLADYEELDCFFPYTEKEHFVRKFGIDRNVSINYITQEIQFYENFNDKIDLSRPIPIFGTVVQVAIVIAIYMGFSEIYLLGCDETGILVTINSVLKKNNDHLYSYTVTQNEKKRMEKMVENEGFENFCSSYLYMIQAFRRLNAYGIRNGTKIYNCSEETVIDSLERVRYEKLFSKI